MLSRALPVLDMTSSLGVDVWKLDVFGGARGVEGVGSMFVCVYVCLHVRYVEVVHSSTQLLSIPLDYIFRMESMDRGIDLCTNVFLSTIADSLPGTLLLVDWRERVFGLLLPILHYRISISIAANHDRRARLRSSRLCSFAAVTIYTFSSPYKN